MRFYITQKFGDLFLDFDKFDKYLMIIIKFFRSKTMLFSKFVAPILVLLVFFNAVFCLTDVSSDPFDFLSSKTG